MSNTRTVFSADENSDDFPPSNLMEFSLWLVEQVKLIPLEYRDRAFVHFNAAPDQIDGLNRSASVSISIGYYIPERKIT